MIPLKLQLKNFLSYGPELQIINFEPYSLICLSGKNGHGKSALLDAITWALWGQARKVSGTIKSDDALLRLGQTNMMVVFDFFCNGQTYRIRREYTKTYGKPLATVDFGILDQKKDTHMPLSGKTIRQTQAIIERTLHLDFDSFINSAFLRQGQANEFSKKSPKDRKEILGTILGLGSYELIRRVATEKVKQANNEKNSLLHFQEKINEELQATQTVAAQLTTLEQQLKNLAKELKDFDIQNQALEKNKKQILEERNKQKLIVLQQEQIEKEKVNLHKDLRDIRTQWKSVHAKQLQLPNAHQLEKEKKQLIEAINKHQLQLQKSLEFKEQYLKQQEQFHKIVQKLQKEHNLELQKQTLAYERLNLEQQTYEQQLKQLVAIHNNLEKEQTSLEKELTDTKKQITKISHDPKKYEAILKQFEKRKEHYQKFTAQGSLTHQELKNLITKQQLTHDDENPSCPLCEQNLSASRRRFLKQKFIKEEKFLKHRIGRLTNVVKNLKALLIDQHKQIEQLTKRAEQQKQYSNNCIELENKLNSISSDQKNNLKEQQLLQTKIDALRTSQQKSQKELELNKKSSTTTLENHKIYKDEFNTLQTIQQHYKKIAYNQDQHKKDRADLETLEKLIDSYQKDMEQIKKQDTRKKEILSLCQKLKSLKQELATLTSKLAQFAPIDESENTLLSQEKELFGKIQNIHNLKEEYFQEKGKLENQQHKRKQLETECTAHNKKIAELTHTIDDYQNIAQATSKDGIQALLIQDIIPEIEQEANQLLSKLTDNQAQIFFESLRDLKKGGTKETLDIKISDAMGIRPYELFSGGEAFRIDFAIRIAISKLLARRAGTSLQTLIIDEGFGSQDEEGLAHIMDAIYKIQDDFAKIIIVSHLSSMKDLFPVHFLVEKGPNGSNINIFEQG